MKLIPHDYQLIKSTPFYHNSTVPEQLTAPHLILMGSYARISVMQGAVKYLSFAQEHSTKPDMMKIIRPEEFYIVTSGPWHALEMFEEDTIFNIDFFDKVTP